MSMCIGKVVSMTRFWDIQLVLDSTYTEEEQKTVIVNSRSMVHFIERHLYPLNFRSKFSRLVISCSKLPVETEFSLGKDPAIAHVNISQDLGCFIHSDDEKYLAFEKILKHGFEVAEKYAELPKSEVFDAIEQFKSTGFKNEWVHIEKTWKRKGVTCIIECHHKLNTFQLVQKLYKCDALVHSSIIAESMPREWLFNQLLGKVVLKEGGKLIYSVKSEVLSIFVLDTNKLEIFGSV
ncbi:MULTISPECIES: hypothetical protein [unclassified Pseudoalteromonas]|jgi:hypothetical protein|uniref:hypothetical protein n=1 Tax=unclassified Pseudoalteromonas TaxID=194690 RepID=UPI001600C7A7|nr:MULTISPECIES: hypothetical protein [unclassified Pseudoalteromonas]MBB1350032.1 hypothetical protein [Pseudoalteromonas sp. SG45-3]MBB1356450.1 hypothetical protein [Pseudoalteromonas sp. SG45-6]